MQRKEKRVEGRKEVKWLSRQNGVEVVVLGQAGSSYKVLRTTNIRQWQHQKDRRVDLSKNFCKRPKFWTE